MSFINLFDLLNILQYKHVYNFNENICIKEISFDSRQVKPGSIFVAIKGEQHDGNLYIQEALEKGAAAIIAENAPPENYSEDYSAPWIHVFDSKLALAQLSAGFYGNPSREILLIGVTGTSGKTTITSMLEKIYKTAGFNTGLIGTVNVKCKEDTWPAAMTTPDAQEMQKLLRLMVDNNATHAAMEVSSHSLAQRRVDGIYFRGAVFTNISPNHLDYHQKLENYADTKKRLTTLVKEGGFVLSNGNEPFFMNINVPEGVSLFFYGNDPSHDFYISNEISLGKEGSKFELNIQNQDLSKKLSLSKKCYRFHITLLGRHNVFNAAAAAAAAILTGIPERFIFHGLSLFRGVERRMQLYQLGALYIIDDKAMSPGGVNAVFETLQDLSFSGSHIVVVYALRGSRGTRVNEDNGRILAQWLNYLHVRDFISTSSVSHVKEKDRVLQEEKEAFFRGTGSVGLLPIHFEELAEAIAQALKVSAPGTILLLLGSKGMDAGLNIVTKQIQKEEPLTVPIYSK